MAGMAAAQDSGQTKKDIMNKVEAMLKAEREHLLARINKLLDKKLGGKQPGFLGIEGKETEQGVQITNVVKDAPAMKGGLVTNDVVVAVNGKTVATIAELRKLFGDLGAGQKVTIRFLHDGKPQEAAIVLAAREDDDDDDEDGEDEDDDD
jgi:S1-C subfamily serine protease